MKLTRVNIFAALALVLLASGFGLTVNAQTCAPVPVGLVSWYSADSNALDSRSRNNGTLLNGATFGAGRVGQSFVFDGVNDSVQVPHNANQNINGSFSMETWIFPRSVNNNSPRILEKSDISNRWLLFINQSSPANALGLTINASQLVIVSAANSITLNQWSHVAFTYNSLNLQVKLFINGTQVAATTTTPITTISTNPLTIGNDFESGTRPFDGFIDEPAIYNAELSTNQILAIFDAGTAGKCKPTATISHANQIAWWGGDANPNDISGGAQNGVLVNGTSFAVGKVGQAFSFDGVDDYVRLPDNFLPYPTSGSSNAPLSFETWFRTSTGGVIFGQQNSVPFGGVAGAVPAVYVGLNGRLYCQMFWKGSVDPIVSAGTVNDGVFHHVAVTYDGTNQRAYLDGVLIGEKPHTQQGYVSVYKYQLGTGNTGINWPSSPGVGFGWFSFAGLIDEPAVYTSALSQAEIASIFNAGIAGKLKDGVTAAGSNVTVSTKSDATVNFPTVTTAGITQQIPLDISLLPALPGGSTFTGLAYDISTSAAFTGTPTLCFNLPSLSAAQFLNLGVLHLEAGVWIDRGVAKNTAARVICASSPTLSPFVIAQVLAPTAANASISGRVLTAEGSGVRNAIVQLTDQQGNVRSVRTSSFGYYRFDDVPSGETYLLSVVSKRFQFANPTRLISVVDDLTGEDFVALP